MPRESQAQTQRRTEQITSSLARTYPNAHCQLNYSNPLELLVATILSAQCADKQVNLVTADLFQKYRRAQDYAQAPEGALEEDLRRIGLYRNKARSLRRCGRQLLECHQGEVPQSMTELTRLDGVGRKTANVVLGNAFGRNDGVVVDTHVARLSRRLNLSRHDSPELIEQDLMRLVPRALWTQFSHLLIWHGRQRCFARNPDCLKCEVREFCPSADRVRKA